MPSFEKNTASGLWSVRFRETLPDGTMKNKRLSGFKTKKEAQWGYEDYISEKTSENANKSASERAGDMLFDDLLSEYLTFKEKRTKATSFYDIKNKFANGLIPYFSGKRMADITPKMISDWIENIDYSYATKKWLFSQLSSVYIYAEKYFDIKNIMLKVDKPKNMELPKEMQIWTPEEFYTFHQHVDREDYALFFELIFILGCRRGEASALTYNDILDDNKIRINKSISFKSSDSAYVVTTAKTKGSNRTVTVPAFLIAKLKEKEASDQESLEDTFSKDLYIFGGERPFPQTTVDRLYKQAVARSGVPYIRIHDLRHSCASILISKGVSIVAVSRQLGHSNIEQTLNTYSHMMPDDHSKILAALSDIKK